MAPCLHIFKKLFGKSLLHKLHLFPGGPGIFGTMSALNCSPEPFSIARGPKGWAKMAANLLRFDPCQNGLRNTEMNPS